MPICDVLQHPLPLKPGHSWALKRQRDDCLPVDAQMSAAEEPGELIHGPTQFGNGNTAPVAIPPPSPLALVFNTEKDT